MAARRPKGGKTTFSAKEIEAINEQDSGDVLREANGITGTVRVTTGGISIDWVWRYRSEGKVKELRLGSWPKKTMPQIRQVRDEAAILLRGGRDPAAERQAERLKAKAEQEAAIVEQKVRLATIEAQKRRMTVSDLFWKWHKLELSGRKDKGAETERSFQKDVLPKIGDMAAEDVRRNTIAKVLDVVVERGARIVARNMLGDLRQMFGFAIRRGLLENDPTSHMKRDDFGKKVERDRVLSEAEIRILPRMIETASMYQTSAAAIWIMLATCCRVGELSRARWADVDLDAGVWRIPSENAKNAKEHIVNLSDFAVRHFEIIKAITGHQINERGEIVPGEWVLPAKHNDGAVCVKSLAKQIGDRQRDGQPMKNRSPMVNSLKFPGGKWTPHDLRRTGATLMVALGVLPDVVERCLNHIEQNKVKRTYQRHEFRQEMRAAWLLLGDRLDLLTRQETDNVVTLPTAKVA